MGQAPYFFIFFRGPSLSSSWAGPLLLLRAWVLIAILNLNNYQSSYLDKYKIKRENLFILTYIYIYIYMNVKDMDIFYIIICLSTSCSLEETNNLEKENNM